MDLFLVQIVALVLVVELVVVVAIVALFALLSLLLKGFTIIGVVCRILSVQETIELLFSVVFVALIETAFLVPAGFFLLDNPLLAHSLDGESLNADSNLSHISVNSLIVCSCTLDFWRCIYFIHLRGVPKSSSSSRSFFGNFLEFPNGMLRGN